MRHHTAPDAHFPIPEPSPLTQASFWHTLLLGVDMLHAQNYKPVPKNQTDPGVTWALQLQLMPMNSF